MRRALWLGRLAAATVMLAGCNSPAVPPQANYATIYGTVYDGTTGQPLAGAIVSADQVLTATTGANGSFSIPNVPLGPFTVITTANGYSPHTDTGSVAAGSQFLLNVNLYK